MLLYSKMLKGVILLFAYFERILFYGVDGFDDDNDRIENKYPFCFIPFF